MKIHLEYLTGADAKMPYLVLLHGWGFHREAWPPSWLLALQEKFQVVLVDLPGHGQAGFSYLPRQGQILLTGMGANQDHSLAVLDEFLQSLNGQLPANFALMGWSLGGQIAIRMAASMPNRISSLVTLATNPSFVQRPNWPAAMSPDVLAKFIQDYLNNPEKALKRFCLLQTQSATSPDCLPWLQQQGQVCEGQAIGLSWLATLDQTQEWQRLTCPLLAVFAEQDALVPNSIMKYMMGNSANAQTLALQGCHALPCEYADTKANSLWMALDAFWKPLYV